MWRIWRGERGPVTGAIDCGEFLIERYAELGFDVVASVSGEQDVFEGGMVGCCQRVFADLGMAV